MQGNTPGAQKIFSKHKFVLLERGGQQDYSRRGDRKSGCWEERRCAHSCRRRASPTPSPSTGQSHCTAAAQNELCEIQLCFPGCKSMKSGL